MKIYMYSKDEAERNHCPKPVEPVVPIVIYAAIFVVLLFVTIFAFAFLVVVVDSVILGLVPWAILILYAVYGLKFVLSQLRIGIWATHTAFIKENDVLWAVRLMYTFFPAFYTGSRRSWNDAADSMVENQILKRELEERIVHPESYRQALVEARELQAITRDVDKNFKFIFSGKQSVIRLDGIQFLKETDRTEIYTYKDYRGKNTELEVPKAYPGLKEEILHTKKVEHEFPFPKNPKVKVSENPMMVLLIASLVMAGLIVIGILFG